MWKGNRELTDFGQKINEATFAADLHLGGELFRDVERHVMEHANDEVEL